MVLRGGRQRAVLTDEKEHATRLASKHKDKANGDGKRADATAQLAW
jgi:hypothetical protein